MEKESGVMLKVRCLGSLGLREDGSIPVFQLVIGKVASRRGVTSGFSDI